MYDSVREEVQIVSGRKPTRRLQLRRLPEALRVAALAAIADDPRSTERWIWAELLELACFAPDPHPPWRTQVQSWARVRTPEPAQIRDMALHAVARGWQSMQSTERTAALAIGARQWGRVALELVESGRFGPVATFVSFLTDVGDSACHRALFRVATIDHEGAEDADRAAMKLAQSVIVRLEQDEIVSLLSCVAESLDRGDAKVRRGVAWSAWALLEGASPRRTDATPARHCILNRAVASSDGPGRALVSVLRWDRDPMIRLAALRWCQMPGLERSCVERLARASSRREHELVLQQAHLVARPARARLLGLIRADRTSTSGPLPDHATASSLSIEARRNLARFAKAIGADSGAHASPTETLLTDTDDLCRLTAAFRGNPTDARDLSFDPSPSVARVAITRWSRCGITPARRHGPSPEVRRILDIMAMSAHPQVRRVAREDLRGVDPFQPDRPESRLSALRLLRADRDGFISSVRHELASSDCARVVRAVRAMEALRIVPDLRSDLMSLLGRSREGTEEAHRLRATITRALGVLSDVEAISTVESMSDDPDPRVRANAIDALVLGPALTSRPDALLARLIELKRADSHRLRGAAVRGLAALVGRNRIGPAEVRDEIDRLKRDERSPHALAGAWAESRARIYLDRTVVPDRTSARAAPTGAAHPWTE